MTAFSSFYYSSIHSGRHTHKPVRHNTLKLVALLIICGSLLLGSPVFAEDREAYPFSERNAKPASRLVTSFVAQLINDPNYSPGAYVDQRHREHFKAAIDELYQRMLRADEDSCLARTVTSAAYRRFFDFDLATSGSDLHSGDSSTPGSPFKVTQQFFKEHRGDQEFVDAIIEMRIVEHAKIFADTLIRFTEDVCNAGNEGLCKKMSSIEHEKLERNLADSVAQARGYGLTILSPAERKQFYEDVREIAGCKAVKEFDDTLEQMIYETARNQAVQLAQALK